MRFKKIQKFYADCKNLIGLGLAPEESQKAEAQTFNSLFSIWEVGLRNQRTVSLNPFLSVSP